MKKLLTLVSIILFAIALTACGNDKSGNSYDSKKTVTIKNTYEFKDKNNTHHRGETKTDTVKVPYNPNRVAVLDYGALDVMKQLGLQNKIVSIAKGQGNSFLPSSLAEFKDDKYSNLGNPGRPNFDQLAKSKPELILASFRQAHTKTIDEMKKAAPNAKILFVSPDNDHYLSSIKSHTSTIGKIFNKENEANDLNKKLEQQVTETKKSINHESVLFLVVDDKGIKAFSSNGRFGGFLNKDLGIKHVDKKMKDNSAGNNINYEYLNKVNPDKIFVIDRTKNGTDDKIPSILQNKVIENVKAIKNHQVYQFESNAWYFGEGGNQLTIEQLKRIKEAFLK